MPSWWGYVNEELRPSDKPQMGQRRFSDGVGVGRAWNEANKASMKRRDEKNKSQKRNIALRFPQIFCD